MKKTILITIICLLSVLFAKANETGVFNKAHSITIYWDASLSLQSKNIDKEFEFLDAYFVENPTTEVNLVVFSNSIEIQKKFTIVASNWSLLKNTLQNIVYDGVALFHILQQPIPADKIFVFTDGFTVLDHFILDKNIPTYIISSTNRASKNLLIQESEVTGGRFIDLTKQQITATVKTVIKVHPKTAVFISTKGKKLQKSRIQFHKKQLQGTVYDIDGVLKGATIKVKGKQVFVLSNENGAFSITASYGEKLLISYVGKQAQELQVEHQEALNIFLANDKNTVLDEVIINSNLTKEEDLIETGYGKIDKKKLGFQVKVIQSKDFNQSAYTLSQAIQAKVGAMRGGGTFNLNSRPLIILDGFQFSRGSSNESALQTNVLEFIHPETVASVTILKGLAATNRYGSEGAAGVFIITTKSFASFGKATKKPINTALLKNNSYTEKVARISSSSSLYQKSYIKELEKYKTLQEVYTHYLKKRAFYIKDPLYVINLSDYIALWGNKKIAAKILTNTLETTKQDVSLLRLVAYKLEEQQNYTLAKKVYKRIQEIRPKEAQSYRDLALIYVKTKEYSKALTVYRNIYNKKYKGVDFSGLQKIITNELKHLITVKGAEINTLGLSKNYTLTKMINTRIVVEWSSKDASFELQFVNPQKKFFMWTHTKETNGFRLYNENQQGFNTEEFLVDNTNKGEWIINIERKQENTTNKPIAIKYTVYKNYGKSTETKETNVIILNNVTKKQLLGKIVI